MDRVFEAGAVLVAPSAPAGPSTGYVTGGNPVGGVPATKPGPWWFHMITEEIRAVLVAAGLTPDHTNLGQLAAAIPLLSPAFATNAEVWAGALTNKVVSPAGLASFAKSLAANGYARLAGGLIVQWGQATSSASNPVSVTFPLAYPTACRAISFGPIYASGGMSSSQLESSPTTTGFTFGHFIASGRISQSSMWLSVGH